MPTYETATTTSESGNSISGKQPTTACCSTITNTSGSPVHLSSPKSSDNIMRQDVGSSSGAAAGASLAKRDSNANSQSGRSSLSSSTLNGSSDEVRLPSSNADYDYIRNTTLMFFLDRLYIASKDGKEARTLHDLSCLFGTKEFTKEMRQIVGASRNGLKKFLQCYPSLFTIDGDKVYLTQLKQDAVAPVRDYNKEAVEYFIQKLMQFGTSLVPIRNLFGYRSQASQEVRHVSGKSSKEFKQFLGAHDDVFEILADEYVVLKSALKELESRGESYSSLQQSFMLSQPSEETVIDPYLNKQFAHLIEDCMKNMPEFKQQQQTTPITNQDQNQLNNDDNNSDGHRVTIEYLHEKILKDCNNQLFLKMVKTIEDLKMFLRMHPKIFKRFRCDQDQRDYVSLLTEDERKEMESSSYHQSILTRQHSTLRRTETNESNLSENSSSTCDQPMSLPPQLNMSMKQPRSELSQEKQISSTVASKQEQRSNLGISHSHNNNNVKPTVGGSNHRDIQDASNAHSSLRATAPPFVPSSMSQQPKRSPLQASNSSRLASQTPPARNYPHAPIQRSVSNLSPATSGSSHRAIKDPRQALRSYLLKATAVNSGCGLYSPTKLSNGAQHQQLQAQPLSSRRSSNLDLAGDDLRTRTVNIVREASNIVTRIMTTADAVAFDCKGYNLGFDGQITLVQFAFLPKTTTSGPTSCFNKENGSGNGNSSNNNNNKQKPEVCIFDLITNPELAYCLKPLLESELVVKIVHDVKNKSNALYSQFGIILNHVFDTQVANLVIQQQETGKPAYKSRYISMSKLCEIYGDESLTKYRNLIKSKTRHSQIHQTNSSSSTTTQNFNGKVKDVNYWRTRPLTEAMVYESTMDVYCLVGGIYQNLKSKIIPEYKPLFEQLNLEGVLARIKPDEIRGVKKERKIDLEVIDLKRKLYSDATSSIVLSNREIRLLRHIDLSDEVRQKIQQCKKVAKKLERLDMKAAQLQLQSMTSQVSNDTSAPADQLNGCDSMSHTIAATNGSSLSSYAGSSNDNQSIPINNHEDGPTSLAQDSMVSGFQKQTSSDGLFNEKGELDETRMDNLMDGSMFDELKDKMIESSSLLESLANDVEEDDEVVSGEHLLHKHSGSHDDCRCLCHKGSIGDHGDKSNSSLKLSLSSNEPNSMDQEDTNVESKAVDMAIQCDLLS